MTIHLHYITLLFTIHPLSVVFRKPPQGSCTFRMHFFVPAYAGAPQVQKPDIANPPTLFLAVESLVTRTLEHSSGAAVGADGSVALDPEVALTLHFVRCCAYPVLDTRGDVECVWGKGGGESGRADEECVNVTVKL
jgi:hypothetical protein